MSSHKGWFVVPVGGVNTFCTVRNGVLEPVERAEMVPTTEFAIDETFGWVAWPTADGSAIGRTHLDAGGRGHEFAPFPLPAGYRATCVAFKDRVLYVAGDCGADVIGLFDFDSPDPVWTPLPLSREFRELYRDGKRIDDLLVDGDRLIAVDNIVIPKYLLRFDVSNPRQAVHNQTKEIPFHSSYEQIHSGAIGADWVALLSTSANHGWRAVHIALLDRQNLNEQFALTATQSRVPRREETPPTRDWKALAFHGNTLLIAAGADGVGVLDMAGVRATAGRPIGRHFGMTEDAMSLAASAEQRMSYLPLPDGLTDAAVVRVEPVPGSRHVLAVIEGREASDTVVLTLP